MAEKKNIKYTLLVEYLNGDREEINFKHIDVDNTSYKEMLEIYKKYKEEYKDKCVKLHFTGINELNELNVLFTKEFKNEDVIKNERARYIEETSIPNMIREQLRIQEMIDDKVKYNQKKEGLLTKQRDVLLHKIENKDNASDAEKIDMYNQIKELSLARRKVKEEIKYSMDNNTNIKYFNINAAKSIIQKYENNHKKINYMVTKEEQEKIIKEYKYKNDKERLNLMKQIQHLKYDKILNDEVNMKLICYKKCYK